MNSRNYFSTHLSLVLAFLLMFTSTFFLNQVGYAADVQEIAAVITVTNVSELIKSVQTANNGNVVVQLADGTYEGTVQTPLELFLTGNNITYRSLSGNRSKVVIKGNYQGGSIFHVMGDHITIEGISIGEAYYHGIQVHNESDADNAVIRNVRFFDIREQMVKGSGNSQAVYGDHSLVENCLFEFTGEAAKQGYTGGIDIHKGKNWIVRNNIFKNIRYPGEYTDGAIHFWNNSSGTLIERNTIINCDRGIVLGLNANATGHAGGIIRNNFIHVTFDTGIYVDNTIGTKIYNNSIYIDSDYQAAIEYRYRGTKNVHIANNLSNRKIWQREGASATVENNIVTAQPGWFTDAKAGDLHLASNIASVINKGVTLDDVKADIDGNIRLAGQFDIGADEKGTEKVNLPIDENIFNKTNNEMATDGSEKASVTKTNLSTENTEQNTVFFAGKILTFESNKTPTKMIHVSVKGNDTSGNGTTASPYRSIERAVREAKPGTAVRIHEGTYSTRINITGLSGTEQAPIWIGGVPGENKPIISNGSEGIHLTKVHYLILHDLEITKTSDNGINCDDGGEYSNINATSHIVFRNLYIHHIGSSGNQDGLKLSGVNNYYVLDSEFSTSGGDHGSGIDHVGCHNGTIANNYFHDFYGNAIQCKGGSENIEILCNKMVECGERAINIGGSSGFEYFRPALSRTAINYEAKNIRISSNLIKGGIASLAFVGAANCSAVNNTIITPHNWLIRILQETRTTSQYTFGPCANNTIANNIFYYDGSDLSIPINVGDSTLPKTFTFSNNLWYNHTSPQDSIPNLPVSETGGVYGQNPLFINLSENNIDLSERSPALAKGTKAYAVKYDYKGGQFNNPPSIGAVESSISANAGRTEDLKKKTFVDIDKSYAKNEIDLLTSEDFYNWIEGYHFNPGRSITRAEFIYLLMKALDLHASDIDNFSDIKPTDFYYDSTRTAKKLGISKGMGNNLLGAKRSLSRQDMSTLVVRALKVAEKNYPNVEIADLSQFNDSELIAQYAKESFAIIVKAGIIRGHNKKLNPSGTFTMQEAATVIYRLYDR